MRPPCVVDLAQQIHSATAVVKLGQIKATDLELSCSHRKPQSAKHSRAFAFPLA
jgi:hypothetical protein